MLRRAKNFPYCPIERGEVPPFCSRTFGQIGKKFDSVALFINCFIQVITKMSQNQPYMRLMITLKSKSDKIFLESWNNQANIDIVSVFSH